jgi:uncharacterized protein YndB with AHSA1/START domain
MSTTTAADTRIFEVYIKAPQQAVWDAITDPAWQAKYGYRLPSEYDLRPGGVFRVAASEAMKAMGVPDPMIDGEVIESDPPNRLVQTWRALWDADLAAEGPTRLTWDIQQVADGVTRLTLTHELTNAPKTAALVVSPFSEMGSGGWAWILSDLKSTIETGDSMHDA